MEPQPPVAGSSADDGTGDSVKLKACAASGAIDEENTAA